MLSNFFVYFISFALLSISLQAQLPEYTGSDKKAQEYFFYGNYKQAYEEFQKLLKTDARNVEYNYKYAQCILQLNIDKSEAIHHLEYVVENDTSGYYSYVELGRSYRYNYQFDKAIEAFEKYLELVTDKKFKTEVLQEIEICNYAKELVKHPLNVTFKNMGKDFNSEYPDYNPYVTPHENIILYNTKRPLKGLEELGFDGYPTPDIYYALPKNGKWFKPQSAGKVINTNYTEEVVGISPDGSGFFVYSEDLENTFGDLCFSEFNGKSFLKPILYDKPINLAAQEEAASITPDGNTMYFSSDRETKDSFDIFIAKKLPNGEWSEPLNIGSPINTKAYNESFPQIQADGKTLYFCSNGENTMGGYDIFKTVFNEKTQLWSAPQNIGYPLNTTDDDKVISFNKTGKTAYISAFRKNEGMGDLDLYEVTFKGVEEEQSVVHLNFIIKEDTISKEKNNLALLPKKTELNVYNETSALYGLYTIPLSTGKPILIGKPGKYNLIALEDNDTIGNQDVFIFGLGDFRYETKRYIHITPKPQPFFDSIEFLNDSLKKLETILLSNPTATNIDLLINEVKKEIIKQRLKLNNPINKETPPITPQPNSQAIKP